MFHDVGRNANIRKYSDPPPPPPKAQYPPPSLASPPVSEEDSFGCTRGSCRLPIGFGWEGFTEVEYQSRKGPAAVSGVSVGFHDLCLHTFACVFFGGYPFTLV